MTVRLADASVSALDIEQVVAQELLVRGFNELGKNGKDALSGGRTSYSFRGPNKLIVIVRTDLPTEVRIRVNQDRETFDADAQQVFDVIATAVEGRWPDSITREPKATK